MNPTAILSLISDLYGQVAALSAENKQLRSLLEQKPEQTVAQAGQMFDKTEA